MLPVTLSKRKQSQEITWFKFPFTAQKQAELPSAVKSQHGGYPRGGGAWKGDSRVLLVFWF